MNNKLKAYINYVNSNRIMNILFSALVSIVISTIFSLIFKTNMYEISVVIIVLTILSFTFQNNEYDNIFFLTFLILLFILLIYFNVNLNNIVSNYKIALTFIISIIDIAIMTFSKIKFENKIPFNIRFYDYFNAIKDGFLLRKRLKTKFKKDYMNENTNYIEKLNINKENILNLIKEDYLIEDKKIKNNLKIIENKKNYYNEYSRVLEIKINNIDDSLKKDISGTEKYHLLEEKDKLLNNKIEFDNNLHLLEDQIYSYQCELNNLNSTYELEIIHVENDYKVRYKNYINVVDKIIKKENKKVTFKRLLDIKEYLKGDKNDKFKEDISIS